MNPEVINTIRDLLDAGLEDAAVSIERKYKLEHPNGPSIGSVITEKWLRQYITVDAPMLAMKDEVRVLAAEPDPVLILGETGTGKELLAQALQGSRVGKFVAINCTSLPSELLESELFGHVRGSFTGAVNDRVGLLQSANGGTAFLDEIGDMNPDLQAKLLRALQDKKGRRLGDNDEYNISARIVCATNQNLWEKGKFRADLYHRISTFTLHPTALRMRRGDILPIVESLDKDSKKKFPRDFTWEDSMLQGNVRSLQKAVRRYLVFGKVPTV